MRILFAGGGTAGHINPAIAIANYIKERHSNAEIAFVGTPRGMENNLVPKEGYPLYHIDVRGFRRKLTLENLKVACCAAKSLGQAKKIIKEFKPDLVVGTGGYVSGPVLYEAAKMGIPTSIHEQNAFPGMTSKILSKVVDRVMISFEDSRKYFDKAQQKLVLTGNPVRENMGQLTKEEAKKELGLTGERPLVVCFAGSLGASAINHVMVELLKKYKDAGEFDLIYATGTRHYEGIAEQLSDIVESRGKYNHLRVQQYIYNMDVVMAAADLLICRSGAITLSEIACMHKASILIPSPNVTNNHQYYNAKSFADVGGAVLLEEKDLTMERLHETMMELLHHPEKRAQMEQQVKTLAYPTATRDIYNLLLGDLQKNNKETSC